MRNWVTCSCRAAASVVFATAPVGASAQSGAPPELPGQAPTGTPTLRGTAPTGAARAWIPSLGAHTMLKQPEEFGVSPAVTAPVVTQPHGSLLLVLNGGWTGNSAKPVDSYANTWTQVGRTTLYRGYQDRFAVSAYLARDAVGGPGHTVSIVKQASATGEMSVPFVEIRDARVLQDFSQSYPAAAFTVASGEVTTTGPATLVAVWWGDGPVKRMMAMPHDGFSTIDRFVMLPDTSGVQCAVAVRQVHAAGTYHVSWTAYPVQGAILWLFAFQS